MMACWYQSGSSANTTAGSVRSLCVSTVVSPETPVRVRGRIWLDVASSVPRAFSAPFLPEKGQGIAQSAVVQASRLRKANAGGTPAPRQGYKDRYAATQEIPHRG